MRRQKAKAWNRTVHVAVPIVRDVATFEHDIRLQRPLGASERYRSRAMWREVAGPRHRPPVFVVAVVVYNCETGAGSDRERVPSLRGIVSDVDVGSLQVKIGRASCRERGA